GLGQRDRVYWAGRATLISRPEDAAAYDRAFAAFWLGQGAPGTPASVVEHVTLAVDDADSADGSEDAGPEPAGPVVTMRYSAHEVLRHKDFAAYSHEEFAEARRLMADLRLAGALRRSRRLRPSRRRRGRPDVRATVRRPLRAGGGPVGRPFLGPGPRPPRTAPLCDVAAPMDPSPAPLS